MKLSGPDVHVWTEEQLISAARGVITLQYAAPNVYGLGGGESDLLGVTRARILYEFEAKLTLTDLRADLNGSALSPKWCRQQVMSALHERRPVPLGWEWSIHAKARPITDPEEWASRLTTSGPIRGYTQAAPAAPMHFYYIYPHECAEAFDPLVPAYAGIVHARANRWPKVARKAPRLHRDKSVSDAAARTILISTYHRYWELRHARRNEATA